MLKGSMPALITPFKNGAVDLEGLKALVEWHIAEGSHGLVPVGTTGESPTLSHEEHEAVVSAVVEAAAGRIPIGGRRGLEQYRRIIAVYASRQGRGRKRRFGGYALL